jgi:glycosyltransferase involved in cell wall biosynthesis
MFQEQRLDLAELIREQRGELERHLIEIQNGKPPPSPRELRLLLDSTILRLQLVEEWLQPSQLPPQGLRRSRYHIERVRALGRPRLGRLRHYRPKRLAVPPSYQREQPPDPPPTISIVTPTFQHGKFLERTIYSVLAQNYTALEYFVQDGGSTDETMEILQRRGEELSGWSSEPDDGQADAINRAFARTSGEIMSWLNSDDLLLPGSLAYIARYFAANPYVDVVYGNRILIDDSDGQVGAWILPSHDDLALTLADYVPQETLFWRRRIWDAAGGSLDSSFGYALDWDLLLRFRDAGAVMVRLPRFLGAFRIHDEQKTTLSRPLGQFEMALLRERVHGRPVSAAEVNERLRPYFRRHIAQHLRQRILDRLPRQRVPVQTLPAIDANPETSEVRRSGLPTTDPTRPSQLPHEHAQDRSEQIDR